jgi:lipoprotein-anchoring transpeptidase ErfK/SrfK
MWQLRVLTIMGSIAAVVMSIAVFMDSVQSAKVPIAHQAVFSVAEPPAALSQVAGIPPEEETTPPPPPAPPPVAKVSYIKVVTSCGPYYGGTCVRARSEPGTDYPIVLQLRKGIVLRIDGEVVGGGRKWYKVVFDEWLRYPDRIPADLYVAADLVQPFTDFEPRSISNTTPRTDKYIIVDRGNQMLYAYEGKTLFMKAAISTGLDLTPTPRGTFTVYRKTPSRYMQGPIPGISDQEYDLPGVPWNLYFTEEGGAIHGTYWHDHFGEQWSHGCVNLPPDKAEKLYEWAPLGTKVIVKD